MTLAEVSIRRPVLATVMSLVIVLFGAIGLSRLGIREYPAVDPPVVTVRTTYPGANASVVDSQVTEPIEQVLNGIAGVRTISSTSREGRSEVKVEFELDADLEAAANDVRDKVAQAVRRLPPDTDPPVIEKADADAEPIVFLTLRSEWRSREELSFLADTVIKERVQTIPGVSTVRIFGERRYAMRLWLDADAMTAHGVTLADIERALDEQSVELPAGRIEGELTELTVRADARLATPDDFEALVARTASGRQIRLGDLGYAELGAQNPRGGLKEDLAPIVGVSVVPQPNTNAIAIADEFYARFELVRLELPADCVVDIGFDFTTYVRRSVREVEETLLTAFVLVAVVIYVFLRDARSTLVPLLAIPVSVVSAFFVMDLAGFSINVLTLVGLVLAIGLVVDDAIVVLENVYGKIEQGMPPLEAAIAGSGEVYFAVIATTVALVAVFMPIIFLEGLSGRLFREFGVVVAASVTVSTFVSLTLTPMLCRFVLKRHERPGLFYALTERFYVGLTAVYRATLAGWLRARWLALPLLGVVAAMTVQLFRELPTELAPLEDRANIRVSALAPEGATADYTERELDKLAVWVREEIPEVRRSLSLGSPGDGPGNTGAQILYLEDPAERARSQQDIYRQLAAELPRFTGLRLAPRQPPTIGSRRGGLPVEYVLQAPALEALIEVLPGFLERARAEPALQFVDADLKVNRPELRVSIDRARAAELGVSVRDVARTLQLAYGGQRVGDFPRGSRLFDVIAQVRRSDRDEPIDLGRLQVRGARGRLVALDGLVRFDESAGPGSIYRFDRYVSATISAAPAEGYTLGQAIDALDALAAGALPADFRTSLAGQSRDLRDSSQSLLFAFVFALVLIYLVLAAQFESFIDPLIIFATVPLSTAGALWSLQLAGQSLNIFSQIGIIMLIGIVTKNGILIVEFANQRKEDGSPPLAAVLDAAALRLRPILMTSLTTILGVLPIALALGTAAGSRRSLGIAVAGGLVVSGLLTLYVVPAVYALLSSERPGAARD